MKYLPDAEFGFVYLNDSPVGISGANTMDLSVRALPGETITIEKYHELGGVPVRECTGIVRSKRPPSPSELHEERSDSLH